MKVTNISSRKFDKLKPLPLSWEISNNEGQMYLYPYKEKWKNKYLLLKSLFMDCYEEFGNKLYTLNALISNQSLIDIDEIIIPNSLAAVDDEIIGFLMPYIPNTNFEVVINSAKYTNEQKINYLKEIGIILEKMANIRKYKNLEFYLNDLHESNFILNKETNKINVVDIDSAKINNNLAFMSRYLSPYSNIYDVPKYIHDENVIGAIYKVDENTEIYCYIVMILKYFYGKDFSELSIDDFYSYLIYLEDIGVSKELLDIFSRIYETGRSNVNPYEYLDELVPYFDKGKKEAFNLARKI